MKNNHVDLSDIINLAKKHTSLPEYFMTGNTRVGEDLYIVGDDADEFITEYMEKFSVDMSGFEFGRYFPDEASADMHHYVNTKFSNRSKIQKFITKADGWFWSLMQSGKIYDTVTLGDLLQAAKNGIWSKE